MTPEEQAAAAQDPAASSDPTPAQPAPEAAPAAPAPSQGEGPWANDLTSYFEDEGARASADRFVREKVQPYVTQKEQEFTQAKPALEFYNSFQEDPGSTFLDVADELFGEDVAKAFEGHLRAKFGEAEGDPLANPNPNPQDPNAQPDPPQTPNPRYERMFQSWEQQENERQYNAAVESAKEADPEFAEVFEDVPFRSFLVATEGDFDLAVAGYKQSIAQLREKFGAQPAPDPTPGEDPPPVIGSTAAGGTAPPTEKHYDSVGEAIEDFAAELRAQGQTPAPPVPTA